MKIALKFLSCLCVSLLAGNLFAQEYPSSLISPEMRENANAVVRYEETELIQTDINNATEKVTRVITILNEKGKDLAEIVVPQDKFHELKSFSGEIYLESGKVFKKIGKGDLSTIAYSPHLASDDLYSFYSCTAPSYPYTIKYTYETKCKNGIAYYSSFSPVPSFACSVQKSVYRIQFPTSLSIRYKPNEMAPSPVQQLIKNDSVYVWTSENVPAISWEPACPPLTELTPTVIIAPADFCFDKICGNMSSWKGMGLFLSQLNAQRDLLSPETVVKLKTLTANAKDDKEKAKIVYEYLQDKTRYVSIQLGIGGWQPISATQVDKTGFGDCKALSNYMKAMLSAVDVKSEYAIVHTKKKRMFSDFSSLTQANHVILLVPLANDSIWLECTSRDIPFNYVHDGIAGHDVLLVAGEQSALCAVRDIPGEMNTETNAISMKLHPDATITSTITNVFTNHEMEGKLNFVLNMSEKEKMNSLAKDLSVNHAQISHIQTEYTRSEHPVVKISYDMNAEKYANTTGNRMFVSINPFRSGWARAFSSSSRKLPIHIESACNQTDSICMELPDGYVVESKPRPLVLESDFGSFTSSVEEHAGKWVFVQKIHIPAGKYSEEKYAGLKDFLKQIDACLAGKLVLKKSS